MKKPKILQFSYTATDESVYDNGELLIWDNAAVIRLFNAQAVTTVMVSKNGQAIEVQAMRSVQPGSLMALRSGWTNFETGTYATDLRSAARFASDHHLHDISVDAIGALLSKHLPFG